MKTWCVMDPITDERHPGEHLAEILAELEISQYRLAKTIGAPPRRINEIVHGRRSITADYERCGYGAAIYRTRASEDDAG